MFEDSCGFVNISYMGVNWMVSNESIEFMKTANRILLSKMKEDRDDKKSMDTGQHRAQAVSNSSIYSKAKRAN